LEDNIFALHQDLTEGTYTHGSYQQFRISDPKPRVISKASVRDRLLHHAIYRNLYPGFDKTFVYDSFSCRTGKGVHKAFTRLTTVARKVSHGYDRPCWALKCDMRKFFDSIDHQILRNQLADRIDDACLLELLTNIVESFSASEGRGIPLGNLTSQLFANVYMDPLDKFIKHRLKVEHYIRYADDLVLLGSDPSVLMGAFVEITQFCREQLKLQVHPNKVFLRKLTWGIDFVGYVALPHHNRPRKKTVRRMFRHLAYQAEHNLPRARLSLPSYLGYLQHVNGHKIANQLKTVMEYATDPVEIK
jgi:retron-type reverse transcriptase